MCGQLNLLAKKPAGLANFQLACACRFAIASPNSPDRQSVGDVPSLAQFIVLSLTAESGSSAAILMDIWG
jgi:hypothetical protein